MTAQYRIIRALISSTALLAVPLIASLFLDGMQWTGFDYIFAWVLFTFIALIFSFIIGNSYSGSYKAALGISAIATFLLVWITGAVGIIGDSDINTLYGIVALIILAGSAVARLKAGRMMYVLYAAALAQFIIPIVALVVNTPDFSPGVLQVFVLNAFWVVMFAAAGLLFSDAAHTER